MAWCQNPQCRKTGLSKNDIEFCEDTKMVLCTGCYCLRHPGWVPDTVVQPNPVYATPQDVQYEFHFTSRDGFRARIGIGQMAVGFHAPMDDIKRLFGVDLALP